VLLRLIVPLLPPLLPVEAVEQTELVAAGARSPPQEAPPDLVPFPAGPLFSRSTEVVGSGVYIPEGVPSALKRSSSLPPSTALDHSHPAIFPSGKVSRTSGRNSPGSSSGDSLSDGTSDAPAARVRSSRTAGFGPGRTIEVPRPAGDVSGGHGVTVAATPRVDTGASETSVTWHSLLTDYESGVVGPDPSWKHVVVNHSSIARRILEQVGGRDMDDNLLRRAMTNHVSRLSGPALDLKNRLLSWGVPAFSGSDMKLAKEVLVSKFGK